MSRRTSLKTSRIDNRPIDGRTTRHPGYRISQRIRKCIEERFGRTQASAGLGKTKHRGTERVGMDLHPDGRHLQSGQAPQTAGGDMITPAVRLEAGFEHRATQKRAEKPTKRPQTNKSTDDLANAIPSSAAC